MIYDYMELVITHHARLKMFNRGVDEDQIKDIIRKGSKVIQTDGLKSVYGYIGVCYKIRGNKFIIKTVTIE
ncbi:MAG: DUF4258 domain-containing protein [Nanoarchaeota archaeon]|nr:DUF4258 domain-containing protein [Nanoarchaeota archaeon]